jgi:hypothetical protein
LDGLAGDVVGATRQVVDRLLADRTLAFRRLPDNKHGRFRVGHVLLLAEERDCPKGSERHSPTVWVP